MNNWKKVKLGSILTESKIEAVELESNADSRIRVLLNANGVIKRPLTKETKGATKYFKRSEGQFIYGKQNLHKGAFGIIPKELDGFTSSSDLPAFDVDESCLPEWLDYFLKQGDFYLSLIDIAKGAATKRIQPKALFEVEIPLPNTTQEQQEIIEGFKNKERSNELLNSEIHNQKQLVSKLKQAILQEAIQGKLTQEWREKNQNTEAASELLERIKAEKKQLIKDKKIRKEKPLPPITKEEIPFEIPESWVWCKLGEIINNLTSGSTPTKNHFKEKGIPFLKMYNIRDNKIDFDYRRQFISEEIHNTKLKRCRLLPGDVIMNIVGPPFGKTAIIPNQYKEWSCNQALTIFRCFENRINPFIYMFLTSKAYLKNMHFKGVAGQDNISVTMCKNIVFPLPPMEEQKIILEKVETLMKKCNALELEIAQSEQHANMLMQAVLKEAFESKTENTEEYANA